MFIKLKASFNEFLIKAFLERKGATFHLNEKNLSEMVKGRLITSMPFLRCHETENFVANNIGLLTIPDPKFSIQSEKPSELDLRLRAGPFDILGLSKQRDSDRSTLGSLVRQRSGPVEDWGDVALVVGSFFTSNYFHWLTDVLGDLYFLEKNGANINDFKYVALPLGGYAWQQEIVRILGVRNAISYRQLPEKKVSQCVVVFRTKGSATKLPTWQSAAIRRLDRVTGTELGGARRESKPVLYIKRGEGQRRRLLNEEALLASLSHFGVKVVELENLSVLEQIRVFKQAKAVVGPHGAGFTNIAFCAPNTTIIDIFPESKKTPCFWLIASQSQLDYRAVWGKAVSCLRGKQFDDIWLNAEHIEEIVRVIETGLAANAG